jgi:dihydrofolate synthase/folylpolyglutamate synthase
LRQSLPDADFRPVDLSRLSEARAIYSDPYSFNYLIAHQVAEYLLCRKLPLQKLALPPCRQERFGRIMLDGAHNASGILTLLKGLEGRGELPEVAIISMTAERDIERFCGLFAQKIPHILTTVIPHNPRSVSMDTLAKLPYKSFDSPSKALAYAEKTFSGRILVAGSLYLCALLRQKLVK